MSDECRVDKSGGNDMKGKFTVLALCAMLFAPCSLAEAQQTGKVLRIGVLDPSTASGSAVLWEAFRQELSKLGWIEGKNIAFEYRFAEQKTERLPELAAELVRLKVDLIVVSSAVTGSSRQESDYYHPHRDENVGDPVGEGLVASLARPGGNVTGLSSLSRSWVLKGWKYSRTLF